MYDFALTRYCSDRPKSWGQDGSVHHRCGVQRRQIDGKNRRLMMLRLRRCDDVDLINEQPTTTTTTRVDVQDSARCAICCYGQMCRFPATFALIYQ